MEDQTESPRRWGKFTLILCLSGVGFVAIGKAYTVEEAWRNAQIDKWKHEVVKEEIKTFVTTSDFKVGKDSTPQPLTQLSKTQTIEALYNCTKDLEQMQSRIGMSLDILQNG